LNISSYFITNSIRHLSSVFSNSYWSFLSFQGLSFASFHQIDLDDEIWIKYVVMEAASFLEAIEWLKSCWEEVHMMLFSLLW